MKKMLMSLAVISGLSMSVNLQAQTRKWYQAETGSLITNTYPEELMVIRQSVMDEVENVYSAQEYMSGSDACVKITKRDSTGSLIWTRDLALTGTSISFAGMVKTAGAAGNLYFAVNHGGPSSFSSRILEYDTSGSTSLPVQSLASGHRIIDLEIAGSRVYGLYATSSSTVGVKAFDLSNIASSPVWSYSFDPTTSGNILPFKLGTHVQSGVTKIGFTAADPSGSSSSQYWYHVLLTESGSTSYSMVAERGISVSVGSSGGWIQPSALVVTTGGSYAAALITAAGSSDDDFVVVDRMSLSAATTYTVNKTIPGASGSGNVGIGLNYGVKLVKISSSANPFLAYGYSMPNTSPKKAGFIVTSLQGNLTDAWSLNTTLGTHATNDQVGSLSAMTADKQSNFVVAALYGNNFSYTHHLHVVSLSGSNISNVQLTDPASGTGLTPLAIHTFRPTRTLISTPPNLYQNYEAYRLTGNGYTSRYARAYTSNLMYNPVIGPVLETTPSLIEEATGIVENHPIISSVYPNPSAGEISIRVKDERSVIKAEIIDLNGNVRFVKEYDRSFELNPKNFGLAPGTYTLILTQNGTTDRKLISVL
ncbi:MAG: T9SS type A sorting domain-containing protein [Bacteroidota bacterium]